MLAIKQVIRLYEAAIQSGGSDYGFECGTGFEVILNRVILPFHRAVFLISIRIEGGFIRQRDDFSAIRIHDDNRSAFCILFFDCRFQFLFRDVLNGGIDCELQCTTDCRSQQCAFVTGDQYAFFRVAQRRQFAGNSCNNVFILIFHAAQSFVIEAHKSDNVRGELLARIKTTAFFGEIYARQLKRAQALSDFPWNFSDDPEKRSAVHVR